MSARSGLLILGLGLALPFSAAAQIEPLTVSVGNAEGAPGDIVGVVFRTYAPRPVGQGQTCLRGRPHGTTRNAVISPFSEMVGWEVFSVGADARAKGDLSISGAVLGFGSLTQGINAQDGPLAVVYLRLRPDLPPGQTFDLLLDPEASGLFADGSSIPIDLRPGRLRTVAPGSAIPISAEIEPGIGGTRIGLEMPRVLPLSAGRLVVALDAAYVGRPVEIVADPRVGAATWQVVPGAPGTFTLAFTSADASLGLVPGPLVTIYFPTTEPTAGVAPATFLPGSSALLDALGHPLPL